MIKSRVFSLGLITLVASIIGMDPNSTTLSKSPTQNTELVKKHARKKTNPYKKESKSNEVTVKILNKEVVAENETKMLMPVNFNNETEKTLAVNFVDGTGEGRIGFKTSDIKQTFKDLNRETPTKLNDFFGEQVLLSELNLMGFSASYDPVNVKFDIMLPSDWEHPVKVKLSASNTLAGDVLKPENFSGYLNTDTSVVLGQKDNTDVNQKTVSRIDGALNIHGYVLEGAGTSREGDNFVRDDLRVTKQFNGGDGYRVSVGDLQYPVKGYQNFVKMGGVGAYSIREITSGPSTLASKIGDSAIEIKRSSKVYFIVNNRIVSVKQLSQGIYDITDVPLLIGENEVNVEIVSLDDGQKETLHFKNFLSDAGIRKGNHDFGVAAGQQSLDVQSARIYLKDKDTFSGFNRYDFSDTYGNIQYAQADNETQLLGDVNLFHTYGGHSEIDAAASNSSLFDENHSGVAFKLSYFKTQPKVFSLLEGDRFNIVLDQRMAGFSQLNSDSFRGYFSQSGNYQFPTKEHINLSLGVTHRYSKDVDTDTMIYNSILSKDFKDWNAAVSFSQTVNSNVPSYMTISFNLTYRGPTYSAGASVLTSNIHQNQQSVLVSQNDTGISAGGQNTENGDNRFSSFGIKADETKFVASLTENQNKLDNGTTSQYTQANGKMSFAFAGSSFGISRPIEDSFFITDATDTPGRGAFIKTGRYESKADFEGDGIASGGSGRYLDAVGGSYEKGTDPDLGLVNRYRAELPFKNGYKIKFRNVIQPTVIHFMNDRGDQFSHYKVILKNLKSGEEFEYFTSQESELYLEKIPEGSYSYSMEKYSGQIELKFSGGAIDIKL